MTRWILLISFVFLFARLVFATVGAWQHQQDKINEPAGQMSSVDDRRND